MALMLVLHLVNTVRNSGTVLSSAQPGNRAYALAFGAALTALLCWAQAAPDAYGAWRELATFALPMVGLLHPCTWELSQQALEEASLRLWQAGPWLGAAGFWGCLAFSSMLPFLVLLGLGWPCRSVLHWATQAAFLAAALSRLPDVCAAPLLEHSASAAQLQSVQATMRFLGAVFRLPATDRDTAPTGILCRCALSVLLVMLGYVLPMVLSAMWEYEEYQRWALEQWQQQQYSQALPTPARVQGLGGRRNGVELGCRAMVLMLMLAMLAATVWDICMKLY